MRTPRDSRPVQTIKEMGREIDAHLAHIAELEAALRDCITAGELIQKGERNGYVMGAVSNATDAARRALAGKE